MQRGRLGEAARGEKRRSGGAARRRACLRFAFVALFPAVLACCGLEYYYVYMNPPTDAQVDQSADTFAFTSPADPGLYFRGYAIYYKLFAAADVGTFDAESIEDVDDLTEAGFLPFAAQDEEEDISLPLVPAAPDDDSHTVTITFPYNGQPYVTSELHPDTPIYLRRAVKYPDGLVHDGQTYQGFDELSADDVPLTGTDLSQAVWDDYSLRQSTVVMLFAASFGLNMDAAFVPIYSAPVYLVYIDYTPGVSL